MERPHMIFFVAAGAVVGMSIGLSVKINEIIDILGTISDQLIVIARIINESLK